MKVLAIDTSTYVMGVAVVDGDVVLGEIVTNLKKNHSLRLMPAIEQLMKEVGMTPDELERIVVGHGPGSYTGVRIGVTTAKSLAFALNIPIVGVSTLEMLAQNGRFFDGWICPFIDARRGQVYTGLYKASGTKILAQQPDQLVLMEEWLEKLKITNQRVLFLSNDLPLHKETIERILGKKAVFPVLSMQNPRSSELALLGIEKEPEQSVHTFVPQYLQLAEAEAKWLKENSDKNE